MNANNLTLTQAELFYGELCALDAESLYCALTDFYKLKPLSADFYIHMVAEGYLEDTLQLLETPEDDE